MFSILAGEWNFILNVNKNSSIAAINPIIYKELNFFEDAKLHFFFMPAIYEGVFLHENICAEYRRLYKPVTYFRKPFRPIDAKILLDKEQAKLCIYLNVYPKSIFKYYWNCSDSTNLEETLRRVSHPYDMLRDLNFAWRWTKGIKWHLFSLYTLFLPLSKGLIRANPKFRTEGKIQLICLILKIIFNLKSF